MAAPRVARVGVVGLAGVLLAGCAKQGATVQGQQIHDLYVLVIILAAPVFVGVEGALVWCILRYRRRRGSDDRPVPQGAGGPRSLAVFFAIPTVIVAFFFLYGERTLANVQRREPNPAVELRIDSFQWQWTFYYLNEGFFVSGRTLTMEPVIALPVGARSTSASRPATWCTSSTSPSSCSCATPCRAAPTSSPSPRPGSAPSAANAPSSAGCTAQLWRGRVVPFLGPGLSLMGRPDGAGWSGPGSQWLPSGYEVAQYLAHRFDFPIRSEAVDLLRVAEYVRVMAGRASLYEALREIYDRDYLPNEGHHFLASLPGRLRRAGVPDDMLFLTTNFDDTLERAFRQQGEPFDLVSYIAHGPNRGRFRLHPAEGPPRLIRGYSSELKLEQPVILKLHGGVDRADPDQDSYVLSEDDYIEYMVHAARSEFLPVALRARLGKSGLLFLGYSMRDWNMRLLLRLIWGEDELVPYKSWAVLLNPDPVDTQTWRERSVEIFDVPLDYYVRGLDEILAASPLPER